MLTQGRRRDGFRSGSGCFKCSCCGKLTRETSGENQCTSLCVPCAVYAGWENTHSDNGHKSGNSENEEWLTEEIAECPVCNGEVECEHGQHKKEV